MKKENYFWYYVQNFSDIGSKVVNQNNYDSSIGYVEHLHQENKEVYEKLLKSKDDQIAFMRSLLEKK